MEDRLTIAYSVSLFNIINDILYVDEEKGIERQLPFNVKYKLQRNRDSLIRDYNFFLSKRNDLITKYGEEKDGLVSVGPENTEEYKKELINVVKIEVTHSFNKLTPKEIESITDVNIACHDMDLFIALMVDDPELNSDIAKPIETSAEQAVES